MLYTVECTLDPQADAVCSVSLSEEDCDLDFVHEGGGRYSTITKDGLSRMWSGARAGTGLCGEEGKFMFEMRTLHEYQEEGNLR